MRKEQARPTLMMVLPPNFALENGRVLIDADFADNLKVMLRFVGRIEIFSPVQTKAGSGMLIETRDLRREFSSGEVALHILPEPYREDKYLFDRGAVRAMLLDHARKAALIQCTPYAAFDWATLAALEFRKAGIKYAIQADWDLQTASQFLIENTKNPLRRTRERAKQALFLRSYRTALAGASVGLLHGNDVFDALHQHVPHPCLIHNPSISADDHIESSHLEDRLSSLDTPRPLRIIYAGRTEDMKGPLEWLEVLSILKEAGIAFSASWLGSGTLDSRMARKISDKGLHSQIELCGNLSRREVLDRLRNSDIFLFCHKLRESPRNLIEALASGLPIVGFGSPYARDLVSKHGGGKFTNGQSIEDLAKILMRLTSEIENLKSMSVAAARSGSQFTRENAVIERVKLMMEYALNYNN